MFCNRCGTQLQPEFNLCPKCGAPVGAAAVLQSTSGRLQRHLRILGIFWIAAGVLWIIPSLVLMGYSHAPDHFPPAFRDGSGHLHTLGATPRRRCFGI